MVSGPFKGHSGPVNSVTDGKFVATGSFDNSIRVRDAATGEMVPGPTEGHTGAVNSISFSPNCKWIASGSRIRSCLGRRS
jgi:WD40 repeat protein